MNKFNGSLKFNFLDTVKYNTEIRRELRQIISRIGIRPVILDQDLNALAVLENSFSVELEQEQNSIDELIFSLPFSDPKREFIKNENIVQMYGTLYVIREIRVKKGSSAPSIEVFAEALWYDLQYSDPLATYSWSDKTAWEMLNNLLNKTGWRVGRVEYKNKRTLTLNEEEDNVLKGINLVRSLFQGILKFDTVNKIVHLVMPETEHSGASIVYRKNMQEIEASYDTKDLITRLYIYGKNGLTIEAANNGIKYIDNNQYTDKKRVRSLKDERFTNPYHLREFGKEQLDILSKPKASYQITAQDLSALSGLSHEKMYIGALIRVYDKELDLDVNVQILKWTYNVIEPWNTKIELESTVKGLSDLLSESEIGSGSAYAESALDNQEEIDLMVFNYLLNSRADDGFNNWSNNGWTVDVSNGYSGPASFKATGSLTSTKELKQTVYPSHRDSYSISFRSATENLQKGTGGRVGINVKITYEDGTTEDKFVPLA